MLQVISKGQSDGPAGVTVTLIKTGTTSVIQTTTTSDGGAYSFSKVMPEDYTVQATSAGYKFSKVKDVTSEGSVWGGGCKFQHLWRILSWLLSSLGEQDIYYKPSIFTNKE